MLKMQSVEQCWVFSSINQACDGVDHMGFVLGVGDAEPVAAGGQDRTVGMAGLNEFVHHTGDVAFALEFLPALPEEAQKAGLEVFEEVGTAEPEVHRGNGSSRNVNTLITGSGAADHTIAISLNVEDFLNMGEVVLAIDCADASVDVTVIGKGVFKGVADHPDFITGAFGQAGEEASGAGVGISAVEVVGIDDCKVFMDDMAGGADGVGSSPRFFAALRDRESLR